MRVRPRKTLFHNPGASSNPARLLLWAGLIMAGLYLMWGIDNGTVQPLFVPTPTPTRGAISYREEGAAFFEAGNLNSAIQAYQDALAVNPEDHVGWMELARIQTYSSALLTQDRQRARLAEALASADQAVALAPDDSTAHAVRAFVLDWSASAAGTSARYQSLIAQASTEAVLALQLDNLNVLALAYQAEIYADQQQYTQASQYAERAMTLDPNSFDSLRVSAYVLEAGGNYAAAIERYKQAAEVAPNQTFIYIRIGQNYRELGLHDQALEYFDRAASINEALSIDDPLPYIAIAKTYARMGEFFAAALNAEKAIDLDPTNPDWYGQLGIIYFRARNYESSIPVLRCAVSGCSDAQNSADSEGRWVTSVNGLPLDNNTLAYYYTFGSVLAALEQCGEAMPILTALSEAYAGDAVVMLIVNEGINICQGTVASDGEN
ncbi:MAG TPA: tetratricopeptide repeat protein [Anaerolineales bacterium]|nr:tetratricopeptide repeat protein [Anaerolineales bacterium]